jgi:hypothetical protein
LIEDSKLDKNIPSNGDEGEEFYDLIDEEG